MWPASPLDHFLKPWNRRVKNDYFCKIIDLKPDNFTNFKRFKGKCPFFGRNCKIRFWKFYLFRNKRAFKISPDRSRRPNLIINNCSQPGSHKLLRNLRFQRPNYFSIFRFWSAFRGHLKRHLVTKSTKIGPGIYLVGCW